MEWWSDGKDAPASTPTLQSPTTPFAAGHVMIRVAVGVLVVGMAVLVGRSPRAIMEEAIARAREDSRTALAPVAVPEGLPSELLLRRPDLVEAEQRLVAANARIAVARAEMFPSIPLTGYAGSEAQTLAALFSGPAGIAQIAIGAVATIFACGRLEAQVDAARARERGRMF